MKTEEVASGRLDAGRRYKGVDSVERIAQRRARILAAGIELFGRRGYARTTMAMISAESGVPHRYLTQLFPTREDLLREIYLSITQSVADAVRASRPKLRTDLIAQMRQDVATACHAFLADERFLRINCLEVVGVSQEFEQLRRKVIRTFSQLILEEVDTMVAAGLLPERDDYFSRTLGLVGAFHELMTEWVLTPEERRPATEVLIAQVQEFFRGMLLAVL